MDIRTAAGLIATVVWCAAAVAVYAVLVEPDDGLSEIGGYISGAVAPIAFLWFILGYYQQGQELRDNTEALSRQQVELEKQATALIQQATALREQNDALTRPYIVVRPFTEDAISYHLRIENIGKTAACRLRLSLDRPFLCAGNADSDLSNAYAFRETIDTFAPSQEITFLLGTGATIFGNDADRGDVPLTFFVTARYTYGNRTIEEIQTVDLQIFRGLRAVKKDLGTELSKIGDTLKRVESHISKK